MKKLFTLLFTFVIATCVWGQEIISGTTTNSNIEKHPVSVEMQAYIDHLMGKDKVANTKRQVPRRNAASATWNYPSSTPANPYGGGTGTEANPYIISNAQHLANLAYMVNHGASYYGYYFKMTNDIVLNDNVLAEDGSLNSGSFKSWLPIGNLSYAFQGTFDGDGHYVSGIYICDSSTDNLGLFGYVYNATLKNIGLIDGYIYGYSNIGGIIGQSQGCFITNCYNQASILGRCKNIGGICGLTQNSNLTSISRCYNKGIVTCTTNYDQNYIAGICGWAYGYTIVNYCYNTGKITGTNNYVAGIVGALEYDTNTLIYKCYNIGQIVSSYTYQNGPIVGWNYETRGTTSECYYLLNCCQNEYLPFVGGVKSSISKSATDFANGTVLSLIDPSGTYFIQGENGYPVLKGVGEGAENNKTTTNPIAGTGTVKSNIPYSTDYKYSTTQMVYTPSEVTSGKGTISKIAFNVANTGSNTPSELKIYMAHRTARIADAASAIASDDLTLVYSGTPTLGSATGWENITLTNPFEYDGKSYLAVVVCRKSSSTVSNSYYSTKQTSGYTLTRESDDDANYGVVTGTAEFEATRNRPNIQFTKVVIEPIGISFANANENVFIGKTKTLAATFNPTNAHNQTLTWTSSNTSVATVSSKGVVTAKALGTTTITAKTFNGKTATCTVIVTQPVTAIALSDVTASLWVGATKTLTATVTPSTATNTNVTWTSSNTSVATVSSYGVVTAKAKGTATITCKAADGSGIYKTCAVTVKQQVTSIALTASTATLWVGKTKTLKATVNPTTASKTTVTWSSSDINVATVSTKGVITAKGRGTCTITCTAADGYGTTSTCEVTVKQQITSIDFGYETLNVAVGTVNTLTPTINPSNASVLTLTWKSTNSSVAKVSSAGVLTAITPGEAKIICTATDGFKKADTITVTVTPLNITDKKPAIADGTYGEGGIIYTRAITSSKYAAFCMPYDVDLNDYDGYFSKVFIPSEFALLKSNGTVMISLEKVSLTETIPAGQPFIALAKKTASVGISNSSSVTISSLEEPQQTELKVYDLGSYYATLNTDVEIKIGGNYAKLTGLNSANNFTLSTTASMSKVSTVSPYRLYVTKGDSGASAKINDIQFAFDEEETTGIENIISNEESDDKIFNTNGQRINNANAQKGVYIKNGKKFIMK